MPAAAPLCLVCGKPCDATERNADGSYAHSACLRKHQTAPSLRRR